MHGPGDPRSPAWCGPLGLGWMRAEEPRTHGGKWTSTGGGQSPSSTVNLPEGLPSRRSPCPSAFHGHLFSKTRFPESVGFPPLSSVSLSKARPICLPHSPSLPASSSSLFPLPLFFPSSFSLSPSPAPGPCSSAHPADASLPSSLAQGFSNNWLRVVPRTRFGAFARGAKVVLYTKKSGAHLRIIDGGSGYLCEMEPVAHFGLGESGPGRGWAVSCCGDSGS